jgi:lipoate-protein ligase A
MRVLRTGPGHPRFNLAFDEALLRCGSEALRLYAWDPPGLSIGFFQKAAEHPPPEGFVLVRRPTGGGAIAHTGELTISWTGTRRRVEEVYADTNAIITAAVHRLGIEVERGSAEPEAAPHGYCFDSYTRYDLLAGGRKFFGSAQRRGADRFLMHGSLVLDPNPWARGAISLSELAGRPVGREEMEIAVIESARRIWGVSMEPDAPSHRERAEADRLVLERYDSEKWNRRR